MISKETKESIKKDITLCASFAQTVIQSKGQHLRSAADISLEMLIANQTICIAVIAAILLENLEISPIIRPN
jgi:hypothetical protein